MARKAPSKSASRKRGGSAARKGQATAKAPAPVKRPSKIPVAEWRKLGEGQRRRYRRYLDKHPSAKWNTETRQRARGHVKGEAAKRRERFADRVYAFAEQQAARWPNGDAEAIAEAIFDRVKTHGEGQLREMERMVAALEAERAAAPKGPRGRPEAIRSMADMENMAVTYGVPVETFGYH
jgi:hypothetical protein